MSTVSVSHFWPLTTTTTAIIIKNLTRKIFFSRVLFFFFIIPPVLAARRHRETPKVIELCEIQMMDGVQRCRWSGPIGDRRRGARIAQYLARQHSVRWSLRRGELVQTWVSVRAILSGWHNVPFYSDRIFTPHKNIFPFCININPERNLFFLCIFFYLFLPLLSSSLSPCSSLLPTRHLHLFYPLSIFVNFNDNTYSHPGTKKSRLLLLLLLLLWLMLLLFVGWCCCRCRWTMMMLVAAAMMVAIVTVVITVVWLLLLLLVIVFAS